MQLTTFNDVELHLQPHTQHEFLLTNKEVALGYGVTTSTIQKHLKNQSDELIEGKHWLRLEVQTKGGKQKVIHWTKVGIVTLGFFIKSEKAKEFRVWASNYIVNQQAPTQSDELTKLQETILKQNAIIAESKNPQIQAKLPMKNSEKDKLLAEIKHKEEIIRKYSDATFELHTIMLASTKDVLRQYLAKTLNFE